MSRRTKGEGTIRKRSDGRWEGRFVNCLGETKSVYGQTKAAVSRKLQEITYNNNTDVFNNIRGDIELDIWFEHYVTIKKRMIKDRSLYQTQLAYKNHISPILGDVLVCKITPNDIINLINVLEKKSLSTTSIDNILTHAKAMFKFAAEEGVISKSPFLYVRKDKKTKKSRRNLTQLEVEHILETSKKLDYTMYLMICTMLYSGIRVGELCALRWDDFDRNFTSIRIDESLTDARFETSTKTESSERIVPLTIFLQNEYKDLYTFNQPKQNDYVFINRVGKPFKTSNVDKKFRYLRSCVMEEYPDDDISNVTPHYLRHTFTTNGITAGVSIKNMQLLLGHASTKTLMETYLHVGYEDKIESINLIEKNSTVVPFQNQFYEKQSIYPAKEQNSKWSVTRRYKKTKPAV